MQINEMIEKAKTDFSKMSNSPVDGVTCFSKGDGEWIISLEVLERRAIPDCMDVLGIYDVHLNDEGDITSFERKRLRKRGDTKED